MCEPTRRGGQDDGASCLEVLGHPNMQTFSVCCCMFCLEFGVYLNGPLMVMGGLDGGYVLSVSGLCLDIWLASWRLGGRDEGGHEVSRGKDGEDLEKGAGRGRDGDAVFHPTLAVGRKHDGMTAVFCIWSSALHGKHGTGYLTGLDLPGILGGRGSRHGRLGIHQSQLTTNMPRAPLPGMLSGFSRLTTRTVCAHILAPSIP